ncbi:MAG: hypothetical protein KDC34_03750 [Saprospiraceae bacterium]|nr:hypothetical protein [Saprospiraceae bacterium]
MRKFLIHTARFLALFSLVFFGVATFASFNPGLEKKVFSTPSFHGATSLRMPDLKAWALLDDGREKMLFLGPSTLYRGVDPGILSDAGIVAFNGGSSGQRMVNAYFLLRYVEDLGHTDILVLDVFPMLWGKGTGVESARDLLVNNPEYPASAFARMAFASLDVRNVFLAAFYAIKRGIYNRDAIRVNPPAEDEYRGNGFVYTHDPKKKSPTPFPNTTRMTAREWRFFNRIKMLCEKQGIKLVVLIPPEVYPTKYENPFKPGTRILNAQEAPIDSALFYDNHHLLGQGAELYSHWLKQQLSVILAE